METMNTEKWNCEICACRFDTEMVIPLLFKHCGHTACVSCIKEIISRARDESKTYINCTKCRSTHTFTDRETDNFMSFPKNYSLLHLMERNEEESLCEHKNITKNIICLDNKCRNKTKCCFICYKMVHLNCSNELVVQSDKFFDFIDVEKLKTDELFKSKEIKEMINSKLEEMKKRLNSFVDLCEKSLRTESTQLENLNAENYFEKSNAIKSTFNNDTGKITLSHKNKDFIDVFTQKLNSLLTVDIWSEYHDTERAILASNYTYFLKIKTPMTNEDDLLFARITGSDSIILENFLLKSLDVNVYQTHEEYFKKLTDCFKPENFSFKDLKVIQCSSMKKEIETIAIDATKKALTGASTIVDVEKNIVKYFSELVYYNNLTNWQCRVFFREQTELGESEFSIFIKLKISANLYVVIYYPRDVVSQSFSNRRLSLIEVNQNH